MNLAQDISVIMVTNRCLDRLLQTVHSIQEQDFAGSIQIVIVGDNPPWDASDIPTSRHNTSIDAFCLRTGAWFAALPTVARVARLRNAALGFVRCPHICFLDDDNSWESQHLSTLMRTLKTTGAQAVHSWRQIVNEDGTPWDSASFPWGSSPERKAEIHRTLLEAGVIRPGSNIFRDVFNLDVEGELIAAVDMGAWLFDRRVFDALRFEIDYTEWEIANSVTEDDKLLAAMRQQRLSVRCSKVPSLIYRLGGYSNAQIPA